MLIRWDFRRMWNASASWPWCLGRYVMTFQHMWDHWSDSYHVCVCAFKNYELYSIWCSTFICICSCMSYASVPDFHCQYVEAGQEVAWFSAMHLWLVTLALPSCSVQLLGTLSVQKTGAWVFFSLLRHQCSAVISWPLDITLSTFWKCCSKTRVLLALLSATCLQLVLIIVLFSALRLHTALIDVCWDGAHRSWSCNYSVETPYTSCLLTRDGSATTFWIIVVTLFIFESSWLDEWYKMNTEEGMKGPPQTSPVLAGWLDLSIFIIILTTSIFIKDH